MIVIAMMFHNGKEIFNSLKGNDVYLYAVRSAARRNFLKQKKNLDTSKSFKFEKWSCRDEKTPTMHHLANLLNVIT